MKQRIKILLFGVFFSYAFSSLHAEDLEYLWTTTALYTGGSTLSGASAYTTPSASNSYVGWIWFPYGFTVASGGSISLNIIPPVKGTIDLNDTTLTITGDLELASNATIASNDGKIDGQDNAIILSDQLALNSTLTFIGDTIIDGKNNNLTLDTNGKLWISNNTTVTLQNLILKNVSNSAQPNIVMEGSGSKLVLDNVTVWPDGDYTLTQGSIFVYNDVTIAGSTHKFSYQSTNTSYIMSQSELLIEHGVTFSYDTNAYNLIKMTDDTSHLTLDSSTLYANSTGLLLTKGTIMMDGLVTLSADGQDVDHAIKFGDSGGDVATTLLLAGANTQVYGFVDLTPFYIYGVSSRVILIDSSSKVKLNNAVEAFCDQFSLVEGSYKTIAASTYDINNTNDLMCELVIDNSDAIVAGEAGGLAPWVEATSDWVDKYGDVVVDNSEWIALRGDLVVENSDAVDRAWNLALDNSNWIEKEGSPGTTDVSSLEARMDYIDTWSVTIDHGPGNIDIITTSTNLIYNLWLSQYHKLDIDTATAGGNVTFDGKTHLIHFARESKDPAGSDPMLIISGGNYTKFLNTVFKDFSPQYVDLQNGSDIFFGDGTTIEITTDEQIDSNYTISCEGNVTINCFGNSLDLSTNTYAIDVLTSSTLNIQNARIKGLGSGNIRLLAADSTLTLSNCTLELDNTYTFSMGYLNVYHNNIIEGRQTFAYQSPQQLTIKEYSQLRIDMNTTFSCDFGTSAANASNDKLVMTDNTSQLFLFGCNMYVTPTGLQLTKGTMILDHIVQFEGESSSVSGAIIFGNGNSSDNLNIEVLPGGDLVGTSGYFKYQNV